MESHSAVPVPWCPQHYGSVEFLKSGVLPPALFLFLGVPYGSPESLVFSYEFSVLFSVAVKNSASILIGVESVDSFW